MVAILGANSVSGGYEVSNSLRFNDNDSAYLSRSPSAGDRHTFTISMWVKRSNLGDTTLISSGLASDLMNINFASGGELGLYNSNGGDIQLSRKFRDVSAWYHIVISADTDQSTASDRIKFYVNGVQETAFNSASYPSQGLDMMFNVNSSFPISIGKYPTSSSTFFDGYMAEVVVIDGTQLNQNSFGEFNNDGVWIPKDVSDLTFGTNGFYLEFKQTGTSANSSGMGADTSGNDNHLTPNNLATLDITEDTCTNNFATLNPLKTTSTNANLSEGNTKFSVTANGAGQNRNTFPTISFPTSGKWYMETKVTHSSLTTDSGNQIYIGVIENPQNVDHRSTSNVNSISTNGIFTDVSIVGTLSDRIQHGTNGSATSYNTDPDWSSGNIIGIALDMDNGRIYYHLNGTYYDDASGNVPNPNTPANHNHSFTVPSNGMTFFISILRYNTSTVEMEVNFGNPSYTISSGNNDGLYGNFEYAPPSGYYALCTKRLAEFG